jgi:hypothetical protein
MGGRYVEPRRGAVQGLARRVLRLVYRLRVASGLATWLLLKRHCKRLQSLAGSKATNQAGTVARIEPQGQEITVMVCFQDMFVKSRGKPVIYEGKTLVLEDDFPTDGCKRFKFVFESCNAEWRQGAYLSINGEFVVNKQYFKDVVVFWQDTAPETIFFELDARVKSVAVRNVWDTGDGMMHFWHNGAAIIVEPIPDGRRYRCNDGLADDDFDDIVFRIERVK